VDAGAAPSVAALSFTTDGYALAGGAIDLAGFAGSKSTRITVEDKNATGGGTAVIASDLTGPGALAKEGTGTLVLTGAKTYAGGTAVSAGTLQLGDGTASGSVTGDIVDNAALVFAPGADQTFAGVISGTGTLVKQGPGTLTLTGTNLYTGATTVSAGCSPSNGQPKAVATVALVLTGAPRTESMIRAKPAIESAGLMPMLARLWVSLTEATRFTSSTFAARARSAPLGLGTRAT